MCSGSSEAQATRIYSLAENRKGDGDLFGSQSCLFVAASPRIQLASLTLRHHSFQNPCFHGCQKPHCLCWNLSLVIFGLSDCYLVN